MDHPFWRTHFPPNGWLCRCSVAQFSESQLRRRGYEVSERPPPGWNRRRQWVNERTGEVQRVQIGIDPGWNHNTGILKSRDRLERWSQALGSPDLDPAAARSQIESGIQSTAFLDFLSGAVPGDWPVAIVPDRVLRAIRGRSRVLGLSDETLESHPRFRDFETRDWLRVQRIVDDGRWFKDGPRSARAILAADKPWTMATKSTEDEVKSHLTTLHRVEPRHLRRAEKRFNEIEME